MSDTLDLADKLAGQHVQIRLSGQPPAYERSISGEMLGTTDRDCVVVLQDGIWCPRLVPAETICAIYQTDMA